MDTSGIIANVRQKFEQLRPALTERVRRQWAASEALALPRGGLSLVARATGLSPNTIRAGIRELRNGPPSRPDADPSLRSRRPGGGRHVNFPSSRRAAGLPYAGHG